MADEQEEHTGGMVALLPTETDAQDLVLAGPSAEPVEILHATVAYLGDDVTGWDLAQRRQVLDAVMAATAGLPPVEAQVMGHATFNPGGGTSGDGMERESCAVYLVGDSAELAPLRGAVLAGIDQPPVELPEQHEPNVWHITAGYGLEAAALTFTGPVTFDRVLIAFGEEHTVVPLSDAESIPSAPGAAPEPTPELRGGSVTTFQMTGRGQRRRRPATVTAIRASAGGVCHPVTEQDAAEGIVCCGCQDPFQLGGYYAEREVSPDTVELVCLACAAAETPAAPPPGAAVLGQDRDLPDPEGWVQCSIPVVVVEGMRTGDGRLIDVDALTHRALPHSLLSLSRTSEGGHLDATVTGRIDHLERVPGPEVINVDTGEPFPEGTFVWRSNEAYLDPSHPDYAYIYYGALGGVSVDLAETVADFQGDEDDPDAEALLCLRSGRIAASTICTIPAFPGAHIVLPPDAPAPGAQPAPLAASAAPEPSFRLEQESGLCASCTRPPSEWFLDPELAEPTPIQVTEDGRIFGHIADWTTCHTGMPGCTRTPRSRSNYSRFLLGSVLTAEGDLVPTGPITLGTGHADINASEHAAAAHYDNTGSAVADVTVGEDAHGVWCAGAVRPGVTEDRIYALRASPPSGDWRPHGGALELVAVLAVNTPGFPIPRVRARVAAGVPLALVASLPSTNTKEQHMAPPVPPKKDGPPSGPPKGKPGQEEKDDEAPAAQPGDMVTISADGDLVGSVVGADGDNVTVEVVCAASMVTVTEPEEAVSASGLPEKQLRLLRSVRAGQVMASVRA